MRIIIQINHACAAVKSCRLLTSGMVGATVHFVFDEVWDGLTKTAVFKAGDKVFDVLDTQWEDDICAIPHEVLAVAGVNLAVGVYGTDAGGKLVIPTVYADCGKIRAGADPSGDESAEPTAPVWAQLGQPTNAAVLSALNDAGLVSPIADADGAVLTDGSNVYIY